MSTRALGVRRRHAPRYFFLKNNALGRSAIHWACFVDAPDAVRLLLQRNCDVDKVQGHNYVGHNYVGHNYVGHNYMGHNDMATHPTCRYGLATATARP